MKKVLFFVVALVFVLPHSNGQSISKEQKWDDTTQLSLTILDYNFVNPSYYLERAGTYYNWSIVSAVVGSGLSLGYVKGIAEKDPIPTPDTYTPAYIMLGITGILTLTFFIAGNVALQKSAENFNKIRFIEGGISISL